MRVVVCTCCVSTAACLFLLAEDLQDVLDFWKEENACRGVKRVLFNVARNFRDDGLFFVGCGLVVFGLIVSCNTGACVFVSVVPAHFFSNSFFFSVLAFTQLRVILPTLKINHVHGWLL